MILVLGGTSEAVAFCQMLAQKNAAYQMSVATPGGMEKASRAGVKALMTRFSNESLKAYLDEVNVQIICDLTHPHAVEISALAMSVALESGVRYARYERLVSPGTSDYVVADMAEAAALAPILGEVIFVTGSKHVALFEEKLTKEAGKRVIYRVIPRQEVLAELSVHGVGMDRIIAMQGPFSQDMNEATFKAFAVEVVIGKEGGQASGTDERQLAASALGIQNIVVKRPECSYVNIYDSLSDLLEAVTV